MQAVWDRFDPYGSGFIELNQLPTLLAITRHNIKSLCSTGKVTLTVDMKCSFPCQDSYCVQRWIRMIQWCIMTILHLAKAAPPRTFTRCAHSFFSCKRELLCAADFPPTILRSFRQHRKSRTSSRGTVHTLATLLAVDWLACDNKGPASESLVMLCLGASSIG